MCRMAGDVVEGDAEAILRTHDQDNTWFMVSGEIGTQPVWIEVELPPNMRVVRHAMLPLLVPCTGCASCTAGLGSCSWCKHTCGWCS